jgi:hypothetical protein
MGRIITTRVDVDRVRLGGKRLGTSRWILQSLNTRLNCKPVHSIHVVDVWLIRHSHLHDRIWRLLVLIPSLVIKSLADHSVVRACRLFLLSCKLLKWWLGLENDSVCISLEISNTLVQFFSNLKFSLLLVLLLGNHDLLVCIDLSQVYGELLPEVFVSSGCVMN